jgi:hypothetical protein
MDNSTFIDEVFITDHLIEPLVEQATASETPVETSTPGLEAEAIPFQFEVTEGKKRKICKKNVI